MRHCPSYIAISESRKKQTTVHRVERLIRPPQLYLLGQGIYIYIYNIIHMLVIIIIVMAPREVKMFHPRKKGTVTLGASPDRRRGPARLYIGSQARPPYRAARMEIHILSRQREQCLRTIAPQAVKQLLTMYV